MDRQGGHRQRQASDARPLGRPSRLARYLFEQFGFGLMTAVACQRIAMLARDDHEEPSPTELERLAAIGSYGKHPGNCYRDLMRIIQPSLILTNTLLKFKIPLLSLKRLLGRQVGNSYLNFFCLILWTKVPTALAGKNR